MNIVPSIESIRQRVFGDMADARQCCDQFIAGDGGELIRGIAVTFIASRSVLQRAADLGANFVITHEPTYWQDDKQGELAGDAVYESKRRFVQEYGLTIWRCHDWWHRFPGDGILAGMATFLGWQKYQSVAAQEVFDLPETTLDDLAIDVKRKLGIQSLRVIGDAALPVQRVAFSAGCPWWKDHRGMLNTEGVDVLVCGELREWETCEYVRDAAAAGRDLGLIVLGHCNSEEGGMFHLANWLRPLVPEVPIWFVPAGDPFRYV